MAKARLRTQPSSRANGMRNGPRHTHTHTHTHKHTHTHTHTLSTSCFTHPICQKSVAISPLVCSPTMLLASLSLSPPPIPLSLSLTGPHPFSPLLSLSLSVYSLPLFLYSSA